MGSYIVFCLAGLILVLVSAFYLTRLKPKAKKNIPDICMGAIRVTDQQGRDMLIIRKEDGSFEMHEEHIIRKQCTFQDQ